MTKFILILLLSFELLSAVEWDWKNSINTSGRLFEAESSQKYHFALNLKPEFFFTLYADDRISLDSEQIAEFSFALRKGDTARSTRSEADLYRSWLRFSTLQSEVRLGLQKLNFGSALLLRPLQWFDTIDPTDPIRKTEGTAALLLRHYFLNNANLWLWSVHPEFNELKYLGMRSQGLEFGGRLQYLFTFCETAFSYHHRRLQNESFEQEDRLGLDSRWDMQIGFWFESSVSRFSKANYIRYVSQFTIGADYTIPVGSGWQVLAEHLFRKMFVESISDPLSDSAASSLLLSYPLSLFNNLKAVVSYDWDNRNFFYFASFSRCYDFVTYHLNVFLNPDFTEYPIFEYQQDGKSIQLLIEVSF